MKKSELTKKVRALGKQICLYEGSFENVVTGLVVNKYLIAESIEGATKEFNKIKEPLKLKSTKEVELI